MTSKTLVTGALAALLWTTAAVAQEAQTAPDIGPVQTALAPIEEPAEPNAEIGPPPAGLTVSEAIMGGKLILDARARYETVEQVGVALRGSSYTLRTRLGWETADFHGWRGLVEFEDIRQLGGERYNFAVPGVVGGSINGKTQYPIINDPEVTELNRLQLTWAPTGWANFTLGRQRILIEDQRFIGNLGWRQDETTYDAFRADLSYGKLKALYTYVAHINRSLGEARDWDSDSHFVNLTYTQSEAVRLHGFLYALDFDNAKANNNLTYGGKFSGKTWVSQIQLLYNATFAHQTDYRHETPAYALDYYGGDLTATYDIYSVRGSYEVLEGNGTRGFITPLALTHGFNGWADAWAGVSGNKTFVDGIQDANLQLTLRPRRRWAYLFNIELLGRYHDFDSQRTGADLAHEWDFQVQAAITNYLSVAAKYADFKREPTVPLGTAAPPASRNKFWFTVQYLF